MDEKKWDDKDIESYLRKLPKMTDERSKEDVLKRLKADNRLHIPQQKSRKVFKWIPVAVAIAAVFFVIILWPSLDGEEAKQDMVMESTANDMETRDGESMIFSDDAKSIEYIVLKESLGDDVYFQMNLMAQSQVVPVTIMLSKEQVEAAFPQGEVTEASLYERYAEEVDIQALGFDTYAEKDDTAETVVYFKYQGENGQSYVIPKVKANMTAEDALSEMATAPEEQVESVIPNSVHYEVTVEEGIAQIRFENMLDLSTLEQEEALILLEGFMLTAEQFNLAVQFENISPSFWDRYDLSAPLPKPIDSNPIYDLYE